MRWWIRLICALVPGVAAAPPAPPVLRHVGVCASCGGPVLLRVETCAACPCGETIIPEAFLDCARGGER